MLCFRTGCVQKLCSRLVLIVLEEFFWKTCGKSSRKDLKSHYLFFWFYSRFAARFMIYLIFGLISSTVFHTKRSQTYRLVHTDTYGNCGSRILSQFSTHSLPLQFIASHIKQIHCQVVQVFFLCFTYFSRLKILKIIVLLCCTTVLLFWKFIDFACVPQSYTNTVNDQHYACRMIDTPKSSLVGEQPSIDITHSLCSDHSLLNVSSTMVSRPEQAAISWPLKCYKLKWGRHHPI